MFSRRHLLKLVFLLTACNTAKISRPGKLTIGVISYGEGEQSIKQYQSLVNYLAAELKSVIELEPVYNEVKALEQVRRKTWSLVFAPPGLAALAISEVRYLPLFPLEGVEKTRSVIVVRQESSIKKLGDLSNQVIALDQPGSATGYYLPIQNLSGLTLAEVRFAPTPKTVLQWIDNKEVVAGALSLDELEHYRLDFSKTQFRVIQTDSVPPGSILVGPTVDQYQQEQIRRALKSASPTIAEAAGYLPNAEVPDYQKLIEIVARVKRISKRIKEKPAPIEK